jgi:hypothetical protein
MTDCFCTDGLSSSLDQMIQRLFWKQFCSGGLDQRVDEANTAVEGNISFLLIEILSY